MRLFLIFVTALFLLAGPVYSQHSGSATAGDGVMRSVKLRDIEEIVKAEGHIITETGSFGAHSLEAKTKDGLIFVLIGEVCDQPGVDGCLGLTMDVRYNDDGRATLEKINEANMTYRFTKSSIGFSHEGAETVFVSRYVIFDNGITFNNVRNNLSNLLAVAPKVALIIYPTDQ
jgi:hypothetical protein